MRVSALSGEALAFCSWAVVALLCFATPSLGVLVDGSGEVHIDPFDRDHSERAEAFREAWKEAREENDRLEPLPEGVTAEEQTGRTIAAFERAVSIMPEAPPAADILLRVASLWTRGYEPATERIDRALEVYDRIIREYPERYSEVLDALRGKGICYELKGDYVAAVQSARDVLAFELPDDLPPYVAELAAKLREAARRDVNRREARLHGVVLEDENVPAAGKVLEDIASDIAPDALGRDPEESEGASGAGDERTGGPAGDSLPSNASDAPNRPVAAAAPWHPWPLYLAAVLIVVAAFFALRRAKKGGPA